MFIEAGSGDKENGEDVKVVTLKTQYPLKTVRNDMLCLVSYRPGFINSQPIHQISSFGAISAELLPSEAAENWVKRITRTQYGRPICSQC